MHAEFINIGALSFGSRVLLDGLRHFLRRYRILVRAISSEVLRELGFMVMEVSPNPEFPFSLLLSQMQCPFGCRICQGYLNLRVYRFKWDS